MNIASYSGYFHDGYVNHISFIDNDIYFSLESSEIEDLDEVADKSLLADSNSLRGVLKLSRVESVKVSNNKQLENFIKEYDDGDILDLKIYKDKIFLLIEWKNFPPKSSKTEVCKIEIEARSIEWIPE